MHLKNLNAKYDIINLRYLQLKLLKNKENNTKICEFFVITSKIFLVINVTSEVSLKRFYFAYLMMDLPLKTLKLVCMYRFCMQTLHLEFIVGAGMDFTLPGHYRKQAAYKQATRGPMALSPFRGTRQ